MVAMMALCFLCCTNNGIYLLMGKNRRKSAPFMDGGYAAVQRVRCALCVQL